MAKVNVGDLTTWRFIDGFGPDAVFYAYVSEIRGDHAMCVIMDTQSRADRLNMYPISTLDKPFAHFDEVQVHEVQGRGIRILWPIRWLILKAIRERERDAQNNLYFKFCSMPQIGDIVAYTSRGYGINHPTVYGYLEAFDIEDGSCSVIFLDARGDDRMDTMPLSLLDSCIGHIDGIEVQKEPIEG